MAKGYKEYEKFKNGERLTHKQAILAMCFLCNGESEGGMDCDGGNCPLYLFMPYNPTRQKPAGNRKGNTEALKRHREATQEGK